MLRDRGQGRREAGAFLLGHHVGEVRRIEAFIPYDDIDPDCLHGGIEFDGSRMDEVWRRCKALGLSVVADVHTHPAGYGQSDIDQANPMLPEIGHMALIVPNFAKRTYRPSEIGIYQYRGGLGWRDHSPEGAHAFRLEGFW